MIRTLTSIAAAALVLGGCSDGTPAKRRTQNPPGSPGPTPSPDPSPTPSTSTALRFAVVGDTGTGSANAYLVASQIGRKCADSGCDFIVLLGDNVYPQGVASVDDPQWEEKVRAPYLSMGYRVRAVLGGHDYGDGFPDLTNANAQLAYSTVEPLWEMPARYHSSDDGPALLLFLDTSPVGQVAYGMYPAEEASWFRPIVASSAKPWIIAFGHESYLSNGTEHGSAVGSRAEFLTDVLCEGVDVYFSGHDHHREVFPPQDGCPVTQVVTGAGAMAFPVVESVPSLFTSPTLGFAYVTVDDELLTIEMVDAEGRTDFAITLTR